MITLNVPVMVALAAVFWEVWYLNEEMLVVASVVLFLTVLVQSVGSLIRDHLVQQAFDIEAKVSALEEQYDAVLRQLNVVQAGTQRLGLFVVAVLALKAQAFEFMEENEGLFTPYLEYLMWLDRIHSNLEIDSITMESSDLLNMYARVQEASTIIEATRFREENIADALSAAELSQAEPSFVKSISQKIAPKLSSI